MLLRRLAVQVRRTSREYCRDWHSWIAGLLGIAIASLSPLRMADWQICDCGATEHDTKESQTRPPTGIHPSQLRTRISNPARGPIFFLSFGQFRLVRIRSDRIAEVGSEYHFFFDFGRLTSHNRALGSFSPIPLYRHVQSKPGRGDG